MCNCLNFHLVSWQMISLSHSFKSYDTCSLALTKYKFKTSCLKKCQVDINFYCLKNPNPKLFSVKNTVKPRNSRNLWVHYFAISTTKVQLFWETEQKGDKNTINVVN